MGPSQGEPAKKAGRTPHWPRGLVGFRVYVCGYGGGGPRVDDEYYYIIHVLVET
jgi:hypothetical protein